VAFALCLAVPNVVGAQPPLERAEYQVKLGSLDAGTGAMEVLGREAVDEEVGGGPRPGRGHRREA